ncbi:hypothetical protein [Ruegeria sp. A3M17]|uniref:hypothetical protein n=1 Tax=Ruegeria sp. A3M17 TaxID=2267229 RepID=UPI000DE84F9D|nr:hypothetical protein [Ruegeria sp. A3M17]RBW57445.1 hypothetical protein DS906_11600 [Ruegeria sp. A3M17]
MSKLDQDSMPENYMDLAARFTESDPQTALQIGEQMREIWARTLGLTKAGGTRWWGRLLGRAHPEYQKGASVKFPLNLPADHKTSLWNRDGKPAVWVSIANHLDEKELEQACMNFGLRVTVPDYPSWHYPDSTQLILWEKA